MEKKTLEEFIVNLSPEERERHQVLIQECLERKNSLMKLENYAKLKRDLTHDLFADVIPLVKHCIPINRP